MEIDDIDQLQACAIVLIPILNQRIHHRAHRHDNYEKNIVCCIIYGTARHDCGSYSVCVYADL